jgi:hypothetical protein
MSTYDFSRKGIENFANIGKSVATFPFGGTVASLLTGNRLSSLLAGDSREFDPRNTQAAIPPFQGSSSRYNPETGYFETPVIWKSSETAELNWRVRLSIPPLWNTSSPILRKITELGGLVFINTPAISLTHSAAYNSMDPVHSNYPFLAYQNSKVEQIQITSEFYCETSIDAEYWMAAVHYLRAITKMEFGQSANTGVPPPVVKLNGYGDFVFKDVPVIVRSFTVDLPKDVDYIASAVFDFQTVPDKGIPVGYAPTKSTISVVLQPIYSREQVRNFNLQDFVQGKYLKDTPTGFI